MTKTQIEKIEDGMILGRDLCGSSGNILLSKGTPLSAALGRRLKNWGIDFVYVEGDEISQQQESTASISPEELRRCLMDKFSNVINNPLMKQIFVATYQYRLQKSK
jgi:hypothetical protein